MKVVLYSAKPYDIASFAEANADSAHTFVPVEARLTPASAALAAGSDAVCAFVNDDLGAETIAALAKAGVRLIALRCAGFNHVDLAAAAAHGIAVARVPAYSPHAVAEHAMALILTLNRKTHRAYNRVREGNFALDGLLGFDLCGKTAGVVGTGKIGAILVRILAGFGCRLLVSDPHPSEAVQALGATYVPLDTLLAEADIVTLLCPLTPETRHLVNDRSVAQMKPGVMLVNVSRGEVVDTRAVIRGLKSGQIGSLGLDVYEEEADLFFEDLSDQLIADDVFARLLTFPNVLVTGHQAFFTAEALAGIAMTTRENLTSFAATGTPAHPVMRR